MAALPTHIINNMPGGIQFLSCMLVAIRHRVRFYGKSCFKGVILPKTRPDEIVIRGCFTVKIPL